MPNRDEGLYKKYDVFRTDMRDEPGEKHDGCALFVLDLTHDKHAVAAAIAYAQSANREFPRLAADLRRWIEESPHAPASPPALSGSIEMPDDSGNTAVWQFIPGGTADAVDDLIAVSAPWIEDAELSTMAIPYADFGAETEPFEAAAHVLARLLDRANASTRGAANDGEVPYDDGESPPPRGAA